jgi:hypothetical protein
MNDELAKLRAEQDRILAMPGRAAWVKLARLKRTAKIFMGNADALMDHLKSMDDPSVWLPIASNQRALEDFLDETERHLHNYVAAAHTRVDHFRRFKETEWPAGSATGEEYQRRVDQDFKDSPLHNFIVKLRNLILHVRLPVSTTTEAWQRGGTLTFQVMLNSADLLAWDGWNPLARMCIEDSGHSIDLGDTVSGYTSEIITFDRWTAELFIKGHLQEIESFLDAARKHQTRLHDLGLYNEPETP